MEANNHRKEEIDSSENKKKNVIETLCNLITESTTRRKSMVTDSTRAKEC